MKLFYLLTLLAPYQVIYAAFLQVASPKDTGVDTELAQQDKIYTVPINDVIDNSQRAFVTRIVDKILTSEEKPKLVIFEIDTPGGEVMSTLAISNLILDLKNAGIKTCAYIAPSGKSYTAGTSWSAGALIAMSCLKIYMAPATVIGAAQPIVVSSEGPKAVEGKFVSALKTKFGAVAEENGYSKHLAIAMVDPSYSVTVIKSAEELLIIKSEERPKYESQLQNIQDIQTITKDGEPLTLGVNEAVAYGLASSAGSINDILVDYDITDPSFTSEEMTWSEGLAGWITSPAVASILLLVGLIAIYVEFKAPGFGLPGIVGIISITLVLFGHHIAGLANIQEILIVFIGFILLAVEIFLLPGFGIFGVTGLAFILGGLILSFQDFTVPDVSSPLEVSIFIRATTQVLGSFMLSIILFLVTIKYINKIPVVKGISLSQNVSFIQPALHEKLLGQEGITLSSCNPSGKIRVGDETMDAISESDYLEKGTRIIVKKIQGNRIYIQKL